MQIRHKIFLGYIAIVSVCVVLAAIFLTTLFDIDRRYRDLVNRDQAVLMQANKLRAAVQRQIVAARSYELFVAADLRTEYTSAVRDQQQAVSAIRPLLTDDEHFRLLADVEEAVGAYSQVAEEAMGLAEQDQISDLLVIKRTEAEPLRLALLHNLDAFVTALGRQVSMSQADLAGRASDASWRLLLGAVVGILAALVAASLLTQGLTSPLQRLMRNIQGISSGDLKTPIAVQSRDEIGELADVLEKMRRRLAAAAEENERLLSNAREEAETLAQTRMELEDANKELEEALATESEARHRIEELNRLKSEFAGLVSHELKTPVSYVFNYATALKEHNQSLNDGQRREFLTAIQSEAQHLLTLIDDILAISLLESGGLSHRFVETDLRKLTDSVARDQQLTTRRHTLTVKGPESLRIQADPNRLRQVLNNLLSNAIKYSPQGGPVEVRLRANPGNNTALIYVRDHGIGIRSEDLPKLFDRFTRIQRNETLAIPGSGLGLYIAHHIVQAHGGSLSLESALGKGTIAQVTVPLVPAASPGNGKNGT